VRRGLDLAGRAGRRFSGTAIFSAPSAYSAVNPPCSVACPQRSRTGVLLVKNASPSMGSANCVNLIERDTYVTVPESKQLITRLEFPETFFFMGEVFTAIYYQSESES
jgi:hypothetical protein